MSADAANRPTGCTVNGPTCHGPTGQMKSLIRSSFIDFDATRAWKMGVWGIVTEFNEAALAKARPVG